MGWFPRSRALASHWCLARSPKLCTGGATIREMREQTGCRIIISESIPHVHERVLTVIGSLEAVSKVYKLIAEHIEQVGAVSFTLDSVALYLLIGITRG